LSDIFNEVDEDLRRDRAQKLWNKYGNYVIAAAVVLVAGVAAFVYWRDYERKQAEAGAAIYLAAVDQVRSGAADAAEKALAAVARDGRAGYAVLARFQEAALKSRNGDTAGATAIYRAIAADNNADRSLRDVASLLALLNAVDGGGTADDQRQLAALSTPNNSWRHLAWEIAAFNDLRAGRVEQARGHYTRIADDTDAPAGIRARAAEMLAALRGG
jgi:hypothetical protein